MRIKPIQSLLIWGIAIFFAVQLAVGQSAITPFTPDQNLGMNINQIYEGDNENINLATGNLYLELHLLKLPGRNGHNLDIPLSYNSQMWHLDRQVEFVPPPGPVCQGYNP